MNTHLLPSSPDPVKKTFKFIPAMLVFEVSNETIITRGGILAMCDSATHRTQVRQAAEEKFRRLVGQWRDETEHTSSITKSTMHPAYQRIIGMGYEAVPLLLRELQTEPDHFFWALNAITEQDPAQSQDTFDGAVIAWLRWGRENGYL